MKTFALLFALTLLATSCETYYVQPVAPYDSRDQIIGDYSVHEYSSTYDEYWDYDLSIYKSQYDIVIDNFYNSGLTIDAHINGSQLYIPWQLTNGYELQGDGFIEGGSITINYKIRDTYTADSAWDFCSASGGLY